MFVNDPIGDFLTRIRNAQMRKHASLEVPASKILVSIADILKQKGFIEDFSLMDAQPQKVLDIDLKYEDEVPVISGLRRVSKPGIRMYRGYRDIKSVRNGLGFGIYSTPKGLLTDDQARKDKIGGEYICEIW